LPEESATGGVRLQEPLSSEQAVLRTSLVEGLLASARRNVDAGNDDIALFEQAHVYLPTGEQLPEERWRVGGIAQGGFAFAKGTVEGLYAALAVEPSFRPADDLPAPGRGARTDEGWVASLREPDLAGEWGAFELDVDALVDRVPDLIVYEDVITYPPVRQDLAFVVPDGVTAGELVASAHEAAVPELREMRAFDVYRGGQIGPGQKSIAFAVAFQSPERTLTDEDAAELRNRIVSTLEQSFGAKLRA
jgi:phenylalanyl-tRNA synthetase beta chain